MRIENSFILAPGIGEKTEKKLWRKGITHWNELIDSQVSRKPVESFLEKASKNLEVGNTAFFDQKIPSGSHWRLYRNFEDTTCFFDIETTGLDREKDQVTTVSFHRNGEDRTLVAGKNLDRENLRKELFRSDILVSFNGKRFDQPFLEQCFGLEFDLPHIDLMYPCRKLGLSGGLKQVEKDLGISRGQEEVDGKEAIRLWKRYQDGDDAALDKLVSYNRHDARNLRELLEAVHGRLTRKVFHPHVES